MILIVESGEFCLGDFDGGGCAAVIGRSGEAVDANAFRGVPLHGFFAWLEDGCG